MIVILIVICVIIAWICWKIQNNFKYWSKFNIPQSKQNIWAYLTNWRVSFHMMQLYMMCRKKKWPCVGAFLITRPILFVASPKLLKEIAFTHFQHFRNRGSYHNGKSLENLNLFNMKSEEWCKWRKSVNSCFAPNKMSQYTKIFNKIMKQSIINLDMDFNHAEIDFFKFANDYACSIAQILFLGEAQTPEELLETEELQTAIFKPTLCSKLIDILSYYCPRLLQFCNAPEFPQGVQDRVRKSLRYTLNNHTYLDGTFPQQFMDFRAKDDTVQIEKMIGVLSALFIGGLKSTTPLLTYACYELAKTPEVQIKLRSEILDAIDANGDVSYENLKNMPYMQCVLNEVMRLHNGGPLIFRECHETCTIESIGLTVEKGVLVAGSLRGILMDEEYFPNPERFDPDRFLDPSSTHHEAFHPFGIGRHNCIGNKFALFQAKIFLSLLLSKYSLIVNDKTMKTFKDKNARLAANAIYLNISPL